MMFFFRSNGEFCKIWTHDDYNNDGRDIKYSNM
jgi:hypothetical protein